MVTEYAVDLDRSFRNAMNKAIKQVDDLRIPLSSIRKSWYKSNQAIFALSSPGKYPDLSPKYKVTKAAAVGFVYPILKREGRLEKSLVEPGGESIAEMDKTSLTLGTKTPHAGFHGSKEPRSKMPYRPFIFVGAEQTAPEELNRRQVAWIAIIQDYVIQVSEQAVK